MLRFKRYIRRTIRFLLTCLGGLVLAGAAETASPNRSRQRDAAAADALFNTIPYVRLKIELPPPEMEKLRNYFWNRSGVQMDRPEALATVREGDTVYTNVAVQLKGSAGSFRPIDDQPALTLNFDKFAPSQSFHGLDKISLNNSVQDESYLSEKISREMFVAAGVPTPRAGNAIVHLNNRPLGVYVLLEGWDKRFLRQHFQNTKGNFYDSGFKRDLSENLEVNSGDHPEDHSAIRALLRAASSPASNRWELLQPVLDVDRFLRMVAMETMTLHWDGYTMNVNNYRIFHDLDSGKLVFMPHGMDQMFGARRGRGRDGGQNLIFPAVEGEVTGRLLGTPEGARAYQETFVQLFTNVFRASELTNRIYAYAARLRPAFAEIGQGLEVQNWNWAVRNLCDSLVGQGNAIEQQLRALENVLRFDESGTARLERWEPSVDLGKPTLAQEKDSAGKALLHITANAGGEAGSWRSRVFLEPGRYRFEARARSAQVTPDPGDQRGGAGIRILGIPVTQKMVGDSEWIILSHDFTVSDPFRPIVLMAELRARKGDVWFDAESLRLLRK